MKSTPLLNRHLSALIATLGHLDEIVVVDAGMPTLPGVPVIDLALVAGVPTLAQVLQALQLELCIEGAVIANEAGPSLVTSLTELLDRWSGDKEIRLNRISHDALKARSAGARAIIRTGETTPYANIILISGVVF
jgi:D-ribose pyranase